MKCFLILIFASFVLQASAGTADFTMQPRSDLGPVDLSFLGGDIIKVYLNKSGHDISSATTGCNVAVVDYKGLSDGQVCRLFTFSEDVGGYKNLYQRLAGDDPYCSQADLMMQSKISQSPFSVTAVQRTLLVNGMGDVIPGDDEYNQIKLVMDDKSFTWIYSTESATTHGAPWGSTCVFDR